VTAEARPPTPAPALKGEALDRVREYLHDQIGEPVTTADLARVAGLSRFQLTRQFQRAFGLPLHGYHLQIRLEEARRRMRGGQAIAAVAADLGFADQSHFHRRFRARFGITPAEWRRTSIQES
jgi:AraC-like DNA-binding protein